MGQYHKVVNISKKEVLSPHGFTDGFKLGEFMSGGLTVQGMGMLLACSNGRGGGDYGSESNLSGSWAGDKIAIVGDYWEEEEAKVKGIPTWEQMDKEYKDITRDVVVSLALHDPWFKRNLLESVARYDWGQKWDDIFTEAELLHEKELQEEQTNERQKQYDLERKAKGYDEVVEKLTQVREVVNGY